MARRKRGRRRGRDYIQLAFNVIGALVAAGPAINVTIQDMQGGVPQNIPKDIGFAYLGIGDAGIDWGQTVRGLGQVVAGGLVAAVPKIYKKVRAVFR